MRTALICLAAALAAAVLPAQAPLKPLDETAYRNLIAANKGKVILVDFWATWCEPCRKEFPQIVALEKKFRSSGLKLITVSCDEPDQEQAAVKFVQQFRPPEPFYIKRPKDDDKFINAIDPKWSGALPALFLYDRAGRKAASFIGETEIRQVEAALRKVL